MLKGELEIKLRQATAKADKAEAELKMLKSDITSALEDVITDTCEESHEYIQTFCERAGVDAPTKEAQVTFDDVDVPIGTDENDLEVYLNGEKLNCSSVEVNY